MPKMLVMSAEHGDKPYEWGTATAEYTREDVEAEFEKIVNAQGMLPVKVGPDGNGEQMEKRGGKYVFDPTAEEIMVIPQLVGG